MKVIDQSHEILTKINQEDILKHIELCGRTCYKSEVGDCTKFTASIIKRGHLSVIEHFNISIRFVTDRGVTHELVRHRLASYSQESTRYCNYSKDKFGNELTVIRPILTDSELMRIWHEGCLLSEYKYFEMLAHGAKPEDARSVLPNSLKTEIITTANLRSWRHILKLRTDKSAHPQIRSLMNNLLLELKEKLPVIFEDIGG